MYISTTLIVLWRVQRVRTTLKEIESLAFNIADPQIILQLQTDLESLNKRYANKVNVEDGADCETKSTNKNYGSSSSS